MGKYYLDYENFATRKERMIRAVMSGDHKKLDSISNSRRDAKDRFLKKYDLPDNIRLKGDLTGDRPALKLALARAEKNKRLGLKTQNYTWAERKAARTKKYNEHNSVNSERALKKERSRILKHAVIND